MSRVSDAETVQAGEDYRFFLVRGLILEIVRRQRGRLLSIRSVHRFLRTRGLKVKSVLIRDVFLSLQMVKDYDGVVSMKERYKIPDTLSNAYLSTH